MSTPLNAAGATSHALGLSRVRSQLLPLLQRLQPARWPSTTSCLLPTLPTSRLLWSTSTPHKIGTHSLPLAMLVVPSLPSPSRGPRQEPLSLSTGHSTSQTQLALPLHASASFTLPTNSSHLTSNSATTTAADKHRTLHGGGRTGPRSAKNADKNTEHRTPACMTPAGQSCPLRRGTRPDLPSHQPSGDRNHRRQARTKHGMDVVSPCSTETLSSTLPTSALSPIHQGSCAIPRSPALASPPTQLHGELTACSVHETLLYQAMTQILSPLTRAHTARARADLFGTIIAIPKGGGKTDYQ